MTTPTFTCDWFTDKTPPWLEHVRPRMMGLGSPARWLEVGSYEGRSALWALDHVLPPDSTILCVDLFDDDLPGIDEWGVRGYATRFFENVKNRSEIVSFKNHSQQALRHLNAHGTTFHGAYLDANHNFASVLADLELLWPLLLPGAVLVCDDYDSQQHPGARRAIDEFLAKTPHQVLSTSFQIIVLKQE
jgi:predicted O-methyltransferase YrrM